jgi:hypothetical protein
LKEFRVTCVAVDKAAKRVKGRKQDETVCKADEVAALAAPLLASAQTAGKSRVKPKSPASHKFPMRPRQTEAVLTGDQTDADHVIAITAEWFTKTR